MGWLEWSLVAVVAGLSALFVTAVVVDSKRPGFELKKADWNCTESHQHIWTQFIQSGKTTVPVIHTDTVCDNWKRIEQ